MPQLEAYSPGVLRVGAVVAASNAALALVQLGDEPAAIKEMQKASRRAPGSADLRAALAALYWSQVSAACHPLLATSPCWSVSVWCGGKVWLGLAV